MSKMNYYNLFSRGLLVSVSLAWLSGCSDPGATSVTDGVEQSAIDAYKQQEKELEMESINEFDGEEVP